MTPDAAEKNVARMIAGHAPAKDQPKKANSRSGGAPFAGLNGSMIFAMDFIVCL